MQAGRIVGGEAALLVVDDALELRQPIGDGDDLVDLLLVADDGEPRLGVLEHVGHLVGHRVLVDRDGDAAEALHGRERGVEARAVVADDGHRRRRARARASSGRWQRRGPRRAAVPRSRSARCRSPCGASPDDRRARPHCAAAAWEAYRARRHRLRRAPTAQDLTHPRKTTPPNRPSGRQRSGMTGLSARFYRWPAYFTTSRRALTFCPRRMRAPPCPSREPSRGQADLSSGGCSWLPCGMASCCRLNAGTRPATGRPAACRGRRLHGSA